MADLASETCAACCARSNVFPVIQLNGMQPTSCDLGILERTPGNRQNQATRRLGEHGAKQPSEPKANQGKRIGVADVVECPLREVDAAGGLAEAENPTAIGVG
ncbi:hypothetical protein CCHR01_19657 [Colletotrichum chrysophilum]|uniref:Uncharacterized protein n=1 Tax=Colletotrichum chrysophilum TaxID=1836956 RepID=A0AAD9E4Y2_9PEZI|nr:hypothetical protein CCHR01_19657 [Colletotrichum chrysophilum]